MYESTNSTGRTDARSAPDAGSALHALAWCAWAVAGGVAVQLAPNPVYVALVLAIAWLVVERVAPPGPYRRAFPALVLLGTIFGALRVLLSALTTHGSGDVLVTVPMFTLPTILGGFDVGGPIETPVVLQSATEAFAIVGVIGVFGAFNAVVAHHELVRAAPRAFHELGTSVSVALAFVPSTIAAVGAVREADRARTAGRRVRRGRLRRLAIPVLERGLEQAVALSESMDARGFARAGAGSPVAAVWGLGAVLMLGAAFVALVARAPTVAIALGVLGATAVGVAVLVGSRQVSVRYRRRRLRLVDGVVIAASALCVLGLIGMRVFDDTTLQWSAYAGGTPGVNVLVVALVVVLGAPAVGRVPGEEQRS